MNRSTFFAAPSLLLLAASAIADGTETLGAPAIAIAEGTGILYSGTGLAEAQPALLAANLPESGQILQVIAYWDGLALKKSLPGSTDTIYLDGIPVTGDSIGGPSNFIGAFHSFAFRADVTDLNLFAGGESALSVDGLDFGYVNNGLSLLIIVDDGSGRTIELRDGSDFAFGDFPGEFASTETQTYTFEPSDAERSAQLGFLVSGVQADRPNVIEVTIDGEVTRYADLLGSGAGAEWDMLELDLTLPAGTSEVSARILSQDLGTGPAAGGQIASLNWITSSFELESDGPNFGCSPYFWSCYWTAWDPWSTDNNKTASVVLTDKFNQTFGVQWYHSGLWSSANLWKGLKGYGWCNWYLRKLNREAVAALANADSGINYPYTTEEVKALYRDAVGAASGPEDICSVLYLFQDANNLGCPW